MGKNKTSESNKKNAIVKLVLCTVLLAIAYLPTLRWMVIRWLQSESYYGHGFLIPIVSGFIVWQRREIFKNIKLTSDLSGLVLMAAMLIVHIVSMALKIYFISGFSLVILIYGLFLYLFGRSITKKLTFPILFLLAMVPLPIVLLGNITLKMKLFAARCATFVLNHIGFPSMLDGSIIRMPNSFIAVEAPCSGLRSLISLLTLGLLFAYATKVSYAKKSILLLSSVPIAIATNVMRITMLAIVNDLYGEKAAMGLFHDFTGFLVFGVAFVSLMAVGKLLEGKEGANA